MAMFMTVFDSVIHDLFVLLLFACHAMQGSHPMHKATFDDGYGSELVVLVYRCRMIPVGPCHLQDQMDVAVCT